MSVVLESDIRILGKWPLIDLSHLRNIGVPNQIAQFNANFSLKNSHIVYCNFPLINLENISLSLNNKPLHCGARDYASIMSLSH